MKWLKNLREIYDGWKNDAFPTDDILELAEKRAKVCAGCPMNNEGTCDNTRKMPAVVDFIYQEEQRQANKIYRGCNCPLDKKTKSPTSKCPVGKWENL